MAKSKQPTPSEQLLELQNLMPTALIERIRSGEASASDLSVARQLLKDNGVIANAAEGTPMRELAKDILPFPSDEDHELAAGAESAPDAATALR